MLSRAESIDVVRENKSERGHLLFLNIKRKR